MTQINSEDAQAQRQGSSTKLDDPRRIYIRNTLGLSHDPFAGPVAEQELQSREKEPHFYHYYTEPKDQNLDKPILPALRDAYNGLVFGRPGSGKTTLRYTLEAECRSVHDRTLVVTHELSDKKTLTLTKDEHFCRIAQELAVDLFIQTLEQLDTLEPPTDYQKQQLQAQMLLIWPRIRQTIGRIIETNFSNREEDLSVFWPTLNRPAVRYIYPSPKILQLIQDCLPKLDQIRVNQLKEDRPKRLAVSGEALLKAGIKAAQAWGFERIFVLVDGVDAQDRHAQNMVSLITPLLDHLHQWQAGGLFFYFFLPSEIQTLLLEAYDTVLKNLDHKPISIQLSWDKDSLVELLHQRLRAAGSRMPGFNALADTDLEHKLEGYLIKAAQCSPRRLLRVVSALIDAHAQNGPDRLLITAKDWHTMRQNWSYGPPAPPELVAGDFSASFQTEETY